MPFLINLETREITNITKIPHDGLWKNVNIYCKRLLNCHYDIEWIYVPAYGLKNIYNGDIIVQTHDMAYDVEYYYRGAEEVLCTPGTPNSVQF